MIANIYPFISILGLLKKANFKYNKKIGKKLIMKKKLLNKFNSKN